MQREFSKSVALLKTSFYCKERRILIGKQKSDKREDNRSNE